MNELKIRHFVICEDVNFGYPESSVFTANNVYEYFAAPRYPSRFRFRGIVGVYFLQPEVTYDFEIKMYQNDALIGHWPPARLNEISHSDEIMNIYIATDIIILQPGVVQFDFIVNGQVIDSQYVLAKREEE